MIQRLSPAHAAEFHALWLDGLRRFPAAFLLTENEARATPVEPVARAIQAWGH